MKTPFETIKLCVKNTVISNTLISFKENEIDWDDFDREQKDTYHFFLDCKLTDYKNVMFEEMIEREYDNMLNKSKEFDRLSKFISLVGNACIGATGDTFDMFVEEGKCERVNDDEYHNLFERVKMELIKEALA